MGYGTDYFFDSYKKQYGKTYLEDFPNLVAAGKKRLAALGRVLRGETGRILDIGCAYGPFLSAAREQGFEPLGIDPAADAIRYVREELGIEAHAGFFPDPSLPAPPGSFKAVTLWYVIEHFEELSPVLGEINRLLEPRGALAFSTPSFTGISGRKSLRAFLENSPQDHYTLWSPALCRRLLARYGFRVKKIRVSGHHPERFPLGNRFGRGGLLRGLFLVISRVFRLGDTFECYAIKTRSL
ncbi:MAG: class I SAM-dependent methyltransferase [Treponema sp.]|nr:class I SAM-dependent methyltransferase [Treponema sp.]